MSFVDGAQLNWFYVRDIIADSDNSMWIATSNYGLIHIEGDIRNPSTLKYYNYSFYNKRMLTNNVLCLHIDKSGRLWVGTEGGGIYLYNRQNDRFEEKNQEYNLMGVLKNRPFAFVNIVTFLVLKMLAGFEIDRMA